MTERPNLPNKQAIVQATRVLLDLATLPEQVEGYVGELETTIAALEGQKASLTDQVAALTPRRDALVAEVSELEGRLARAKADLKAILERAAA